MQITELSMQLALIKGVGGATPTLVPVWHNKTQDDKTKTQTRSISILYFNLQKVTQFLCQRGSHNIILILTKEQLKFHSLWPRIHLLEERELKKSVYPNVL